MKILFVTQDFPPTEGGIARGYADLARGFPPESFIVSAPAPEGAAGPPPENVRLFREPFPMSRAHRFGSLWRWKRDIEQLIRAESCDLILCGNIRPLGPLVASLSKKTGVPYYVIVHGNDLLLARRRWSGLRAGTWTRVFGGARRWLANSDAVRRIGIQELSLSEERSGVILPEVDADLFRPPTPAEREASRRELGVAADECVVIYVGRLVERKGLDRVIEAFASLSGPHRLIVTGYGDPAPYVALAARSGVADRVIFRPGSSETELVSLFHAADLAAMPSRTIREKADIEGFGIVYLEAAAAGLPVVAGNSGGVVEAVEDGVTGIVVDGDDGGQVRAAMARLQTDATLRAGMGRAARQRVIDRFGQGSRADQLRRILRSDFGRS